MSLKVSGVSAGRVISRLLVKPAPPVPTAAPIKPPTGAPLPPPAPPPTMPAVRLPLAVLLSVGAEVWIL